MTVIKLMRELWDMPDPDGGAGGGGGDPITDAITGAIGEVEGGEEVVEEQPDPKEAEREAEEKEIAALQAEWRAKNPQARGNIAIDRHQAVLTRARNQHTKAQEEWAAKEKAWQEREEAIKAQEAEWQQYEWAKDPDIQQALLALDLAERDPATFAKMLLSDDRYAKILRMAEAAEEKKIPSERPKPNKQTEDGALAYYDDDGVEQLLDWHGSRLKESITKELRESISQEMEERYGKVAEAYQASTVWNEALQTQKEKLDTMREKWEGFREFEKEIKAEMVKRDKERERNPRLPMLSAEEAYIMVVPPKLKAAQQANKAAIREEAIKDLKDKKAAVSGTVRSSGVERQDEKGDKDLADIIRASIAGLRE